MKKLKIRYIDDFSDFTSKRLLGARINRNSENMALIGQYSYSLRVLRALVF